MGWIRFLFAFLLSIFSLWQIKLHFHGIDDDGGDDDAS